MHHNVKKQIKISDNGFRKRCKMCVCMCFVLELHGTYLKLFLIKNFKIYLFLFALAFLTLKGFLHKFRNLEAGP